MTNLINKLTAAISGAALFAAAFVMAGLGLTAIAFLALLSFFAVGIAMIAAPFVRMGMNAEAEATPADAA